MQFRILMGGKWGHNRYSEIQNFDIQQAHPHTKKSKNHPSRTEIIKSSFLVLLICKVMPTFYPTRFRP